MYPDFVRKRGISRALLRRDRFLSLFVDPTDDFLFQSRAVSPGEGDTEDGDEGGGNVSTFRHGKHADAHKAVDEKSPGTSQRRRENKIFPADIDEACDVAENIVGEKGKEKHDEKEKVFSFLEGADVFIQFPLAQKQLQQRSSQITGQGEAEAGAGDGGGGADEKGGEESQKHGGGDDDNAAGGGKKDHAEKLEKEDNNVFIVTEALEIGYQRIGIFHQIQKSGTDEPEDSDDHDGEKKKEIEKGYDPVFQ